MPQTPPLDRKSLALSLTLLVLMVLLSGVMGVYVLSDPDIAQAYLLASAVLKIDRHYVSQFDPDDLLASARQAMFEGLDRYSGYIKATEFARINEEFSGRYSGIGVAVAPHEMGLMITSVRDDGPASEAGLKIGDVIIGADSVNFSEITANAAAGHLRGKKDTDVLVHVFRPASSDTMAVALTRRRISLKHIAFAGYTSDNVLYIRLLDFEAGTAEDLKAAFDSLLNKKNVDPQGIILDVRGNPGGLFTEAYRTADLFLEKGTFIVGTEARSRWDEERHFAGDADATEGLPLAVLVDHGSASAAEIVAGALQQAARAVLVGDTTFGKGLVQRYLRFPNGDGLRLTIARYYFDHNLYLNDFDSTLDDVGHGLVPDYYFSPEETYQFPLVLENSLLLYQFAALHQDEIIASMESGGLTGNWVEEFAEYAKDNHFTYQSPVTQKAKHIQQLSDQVDVSSTTKQAIEGLLRTATADDQDQFHIHADFIRSRLQEIAFERKFGTYRTFREVIVRRHSIINSAAKILLESV
jgi:C-terminal peptidase prc